MNQEKALAFVERHGIVLQAARGPLPNLAEAIAGRAISGSWWGHPKGKEIFRAVRAIGESPDVLVCKLVEGKITYVHRRLWPALIKLAPDSGRNSWPKYGTSTLAAERTSRNKNLFQTGYQQRS